MSNWEDNVTLEDYIISLFKSHQTDSIEFKTMLAIYGRERMEAIWKDFKKNEYQSPRSKKYKKSTPEQA